MTPKFMLSKLYLACLALLLCLQVSAQGDKAPYNPNAIVPTPQLTQWDVQFNYDIGTPSNSASLAGAVHLGSEFWVAQWNSDSLIRFDNSGTLIEKFMISDGAGGTLAGVRSMSTDGTNIYAGAAGSDIFVIDPVTQTVTSTITSVSADPSARFCAYDASADGGNGGFWLGNFTSDIWLVSTTGALLQTIPQATHTLPGMYGAAYDGTSLGGPYLWVFHQAGGTFNSLISQIELATGTPTGVVHNIEYDLGLSGTLAGGLFITDNWDPSGTRTLGGVAQTTPGILFGYELDFINTPVVDIAVGNLSTSASDCTIGAAETVSVDVSNVGAGMVNGITVDLMVNGMSMGTETVATLMTGASQTVTFANTLDLSADGLYEIAVSTNVANDIDNINSYTSNLVVNYATGGTGLFEDFNAETIGNVTFADFYNVGDIPFQVNAGTTVSGSTGPTDDADGGGNYIYMEASGSGVGTQAKLTTGCIDLTGTNSPYVSFSYHMYGNGIGSLTVDVVSATGTTNELTVTGQQQTTNADAWQMATVDLSAYIGEVIRLEMTGEIGTAGSTFNSDISLDNISIQDIVAGPCAMWDQQFEYNIGASSGGTVSQAGAVHIPGQFWVSQWNSDTILIYDDAGALIEKTSISDGAGGTLAGVRSMTYDGTNIYAGTAGTTISQIDIATKTVISTINTDPATSARMCTYDPTADGGNGGFWLANFTSDIWLVGMDGSLLQTIAAATHTMEGIYGGAFDNLSAGGPYLWVYHQQGVPSNNVISLVDPATGLPGGVIHDVDVDINGAGTLAGGLFITDSWDPSGNVTIGGVAQGAPNLLFGYDLCFTPNSGINVLTANLSAPSSSCDLGPAEMISIDVANVGANDVPALNMVLRLNGTDVANEVIPNFAAGASMTYNFTQTLDLSADGVYNIEVVAYATDDVDNSDNQQNTLLANRSQISGAQSDDFESYPVGTVLFPNFYNEGGINFQVNTGTTVSGNTGPSAGAGGAGNYIYMETSGSVAGANAILSFGCLDLAGTTNPFFSFAYHMFGDGIGSLEVVVEKSDGTMDNVLTLNGQQQGANADPWATSSIDLTPYVGDVITIFLTGTVGSGGSAFNSDISLDNFVIDECSPLSLSGTSVDDVCGVGNGSATVNSATGLPPFSYSWDNGQSGMTATGLTLGDYNVTVTDAAGCTNTTMVTVGGNAPISLSDIVVQDENNGSGDGSVTVTVAGGTAPYNYTWSNGGGNSNVISSLPSGDYTVTVTDANLCSFISDIIMVDNFVNTKEVDGLQSLMISPNPAHSMINISLELDEVKAVGISIYNSVGQLVSDVENDRTQSGIYTFDLSHLAEGIYMVRFVIDNEVMTRSIMVQH